MKRNHIIYLLILFCFLFLISCDKPETQINPEEDIDEYAIVINDKKLNLYQNYLSDEEVYILSNIRVETGSEVSILKNGEKVDVNIDGRNNLIKENEKIKIHNDATAQIALSVNNNSYHLQISGFNGPYTDLESTVKDGYVVGYSYENHISYTGYIKNGVPHGEGIYVWSMTNCIYFGEFVEGKYEGQGTFVWHNGDKLVGTFAKGVPVEGVYTYASSGCTYTGTFNSNWKYEGQGVFTWPSGWKYEGLFRDGKAVNGKTYTNRSTGVIWYEGAMNDLNDVDQTQVGIAYFVFENGCTYLGGYKSKRALENGKYQGQGIFSWPSGWKYEGAFADGKATNGKTITNKSSGLIWYEGAMNDLNNINSNVLGYGYFVQSDGTIYEGQMYASGALETCVYSGYGKLIYPNGEEVSGVFANGVLLQND